MVLGKMSRKPTELSAEKLWTKGRRNEDF